MRRATDITMILDRSGSMGKCKVSMEEALNAYIRDQQKSSDPCLFTLVKFDDEYECEYSGVDIKQVKDIVIEPRGGTALRDAIGRAIDDAGSRLSKMSEQDRPDKVLVVVVTDGAENASNKYTQVKLTNMIKEQENKYSWEFLFLGADQNAIAAAGDVGINSSNVLNFCAADGGRSARGSVYAAKAMSLATKRCREEKTSGGILRSLDSGVVDMDAEYAKEFGDTGELNKAK